RQPLYKNFDGGLSPSTGRAPAYIQSGRKVKVPVGTCPDCEAEVHVALDADKGDSITCEECGTPLEVVGLDPVELDIAEEDLDDDADDEDDDEEF
ncbi:MAG TPA: hypothetical protein VM914_02835, partial [Pyrinomonadaceae bacterium]|nr:hypothetical protein [Pyrinomonadaceae bacterium]